MTLALSSTAAAGMLQGFSNVTDSSALNTATLTVYQTQISLVVFTLAGGPWETPEGPSMALGNLTSTQAADVSGVANRFVLRSAEGETLLTGTISALGGGGDIETPNVFVTEGANQTLNAFVLTMATNGEIDLVGSLAFE